MPFHHLSPLALALALAAVLVAPVQAQNLVQVYELARGYDAAYQSARAQFEANLAKAAQSRASVLPTANLTAGVLRSNFDNSVATPRERSFTNQSTAINASLPLYRPANWATADQGRGQVALAEAALVAADQDLVVRVSQAYFDVLASQDSLTFVRAQKTAVAEQLASAKRNFEVGTATITDTREAQARFDLVLAQEIAAENDLRVKKLALNLLAGKDNIEPAALAGAARLLAPEPSQSDTWVQQAEDLHPGIRQARVNLEIAQLETHKAQAGHKPTLDLNASYAVGRNLNGSATSAVSSRTHNATLGVAFNLPLFAGYATQNRIKETLALEEKGRSDLEAARRSVGQATRQAFFGVQSGIGQVKALEAAEASSQSALDANKLGYQVGVRINIDVLNSQSQLFQTKRDLAKARYDVLLGGLKLRQANGSLKADDLAAVNMLLAK